jgi:hypothetical protein
MAAHKREYRQPRLTQLGSVREAPSADLSPAIRAAMRALAEAGRKP